MARGTWNEEKGPILGDPYGDWLEKISDGEGSNDTWAPVILVSDGFQLPSESEVQESVRDFFIQQLISFSKSKPSVYRINGHDFIHWLQMVLKGRAELIVFVKNKRNGFDASLNAFFDSLTAINKKLAEKGIEPFNFDRDPINQGAAIGAGIPSRFDKDIVSKFLASITRKSLDHNFVESFTSKPRRTKVVTGIIDHAIGFAHTRFRHSKSKTRVDAVWAQQADSNKTGPVTIGREVSRSEIDGWLKDLDRGKLNDETEIYKEAGLIEHGSGISKDRGDQPLSLSRTHGTQMLDIAAGRNLDDDLREQNPILVVQLPAEVVARTNGFLHEPYVKSALNWLWFKTLTLEYEADNLVVNYSFGDYAGSHDGYDILDADFERRIDRGEVGMITVPVGNGYLSETHAEFLSREIDEINEFELVLQPDDKEVTFVQIWLDDDTNGTIENSIPLQVEVETPDSIKKVANERLAGSHDDLVVDSEVIARIYYQKHKAKHVGASARARNLITIAIRPTASDKPYNLIAPAGKWKFKLSANDKNSLGEMDSIIKIWVERGDSIEGFPRSGRQAYLDHENHERYKPNGRWNEDDNINCPIKRFGSISSTANAKSTLGVGSHRNYRQKRMADYSAARTKRQANQPKMSFPGELSSARPNVLASGTNSGSVTAVRGTSAASAMAARAMVENMLDSDNAGQVGKKDAALKARRRLENMASQSKIPMSKNSDGPKFPKERIGKGFAKSTYRRTPERTIAN